MHLGKLNTLKVLKRSGPGVFLDGGDGIEILLPSRYAPETLGEGDEIEVFIYRDSEDRLIATTETPKIMVGQVACLKVEAVNNIGAFLDWGLPKDLLVPFAQQADRMEQGESYVVYAYIDKNSDRIVASSRIGRWLKEEGSNFKAGQQVKLLIANRTELGYKAVINGSHVGVVFHADATRPLHAGDRLTGFIKRVRNEDQRIDLSLEAGRTRTRKNLEEEILASLKEGNGQSDLTDKSPPEEIMRRFGVSKATYKKALGTLYKQRRIVISAERIELVK